MFFLLENAPSAPHLALLPRRAVAQLGSALEWGSRGRGFESRRPDLHGVVWKLDRFSRSFAESVTRPEDMIHPVAALSQRAFGRFKEKFGIS
jgi:hypothetical protein